MVMLAATRFYPSIETVLMTLLPPSIRKMQDDHYEIAQTKIQRRMGSEKARNDFMSPVLETNHGKYLRSKRLQALIAFAHLYTVDFSQMSREEVESTYQMLIIAGSETTATALVGTINHLAQNPDKQKTLKTEIRSKFQASHDINLTSTRDMPYLTACINEGLRLCNPVPGGLPRRAPATGAFVCGQWLPGNVLIFPTYVSR
jgi:hypothetical protein